MWVSWTCLDRLLGQQIRLWHNFSGELYWVSCLSMSRWSMVRCEWDYGTPKYWIPTSLYWTQMTDSSHSTIKPLVLVRHSERVFFRKFVNPNQWIYKLSLWTLRRMWIHHPSMSWNQLVNIDEPYVIWYDLIFFPTYVSSLTIL